MPRLPDGLIRADFALLVVLGVAVASLQLTRRVRTRTPRTHRIAGRVGIVFAFLSGVTGLFFGLWRPVAGIAEQLIVGLVGLFLPSAVTMAGTEWWIRATRVTVHTVPGIAAEAL